MTIILVTFILGGHSAPYRFELEATLDGHAGRAVSCLAWLGEHAACPPPRPTPKPIVDEANGIALQTSFVATGGGGWAVRLEATPTPRATKTARRAKPVAVYYYLGIDAEFAPEASIPR